MGHDELEQNTRGDDKLHKVRKKMAPYTHDMHCTDTLLQLECTVGCPKTKQRKTDHTSMVCVHTHTKNSFSSVIDILDTLIQMLTQTYKGPTKRLSTNERQTNTMHKINTTTYTCMLITAILGMHVYAKAGAGRSPAGVSWVSNQLPWWVLF